MSNSNPPDRGHGEEVKNSPSIYHRKAHPDDLLPPPPKNCEWMHIGTVDDFYRYMAVPARTLDATFSQTGERRKFETGAHRDANDDKGRMDLIPWLAVIRLSKHFQKGAKTHGERNWEKGIPISVLMDSAFRHLAKAQAGLTDENHIDAAHWNISCIVETLERIKLGTMDASLNDVKGLV